MPPPGRVNHNAILSGKRFFGCRLFKTAAGGHAALREQRITTVTALAAHCHARQTTQSQSYGIKKEESTEIKSVLSSHFSRECSAERPAGRSGGVARGGIRNPLRVSCTPFCKKPAARRQHPPAAGRRQIPSPSAGENPSPWEWGLSRLLRLRRSIGGKSRALPRREKKRSPSE